MKKIYNIAKTELRTLFYSPVAWLILILFVVQTSILFAGTMEKLVTNEIFHYPNRNATIQLFAGMGGLFPAVQDYLYLYIPLLTMGLMSREFSSGSIKLLYSSPVTNTQIIIGKYFSMLIYGLVLISVLVVYAIIAGFVVKDLDVPVVLSGLWGVYFLLCAYAAIGLFMSSITSYQIVAAIGTLAILALLTYVRGLWQNIDFVRELTFWLGMPGRSDQFVYGLICSEDILYFLMVVTLFLNMTIIHLQTKRQKCSWVSSWGKYIGIWVIALIIGYVSSHPVFKVYYDVTRTQSNTLTPNSQQIVAQAKGGLTITTYTNILDRNYWIGMPERRKFDIKSFDKYTRFKPETKMEYVYYYDRLDSTVARNQFRELPPSERIKKLIKFYGLNPKKVLTPEQIREKIDLSGENFRFVRQFKRETGETAFLRIFDDQMLSPTEAEITATLKRLVMKLPKVGFLTGQGERNTVNAGSRDYRMFTQEKPFRYSLVNQGFDFSDVTLEHLIPEDITILVIAEMKRELTMSEKINLDRYVERGGNLVIIGEPGRQEVMNTLVEPLGVTFLPGRLVRPTHNFASDLMLAHPTAGAGQLAHYFDQLIRYGNVIAMPGTTGLEFTEEKGFKIQPLLISDSVGVWNELETTNFVDDTVKLNPKVGEVEKRYVTALALSRKMANKEQKIVILGDADCLSNGELMRDRRSGIPAFNYALVQGVFYWLSDGEVPIDIRRPEPPDNKVYLDKEGLYTLKIFIQGLFPGLLLLLSLYIWIRRKGK